jgi:hypothetical protein
MAASSSNTPRSKLGSNQTQLISHPLVANLCHMMKSVTVREFYHNAALVDGLAAGQQLLVTAKGKPKFIVSKNPRPRMTRQLAEDRAVGAASTRKFDGTAFLAALKK